MLVKGKWTADWHPVQSKDDKGRFVRQTSSFRHWVTPDGAAGPTGEAGFPAAPDRYHLYVALICPWASRTLMARKLKKLEAVIGLSVLAPVLTDQGWRFGDFPGADADVLNGATHLHEIYSQVDPTYTGRATVPVLWDKQRRQIVNNESSDILRMLNSAFDAYGDAGVDLYPSALRTDIDAINAALYSQLNNGVYQAGFASSQQAYEEAVTGVFAMLDDLEERLSDGRDYLFAGRITESDIRLFVTLIRFDAAYYGLFKCNIRRIVDYPNLSAYVGRIIGLRDLAETVNLDHIKAGYHSIKALNPSGIVPVGPARVYAA
jgi:putative glutathione S-transferase|tara:strand:+ start:674 stop:1630 length:957 start_codon:yes stop_codon:yes gene_type:complete